MPPRSARSRRLRGGRVPSVAGPGPAAAGPHRRWRLWPPASSRRCSPPLPGGRARAAGRGPASLPCAPARAARPSPPCTPPSRPHDHTPGPRPGLWERGPLPCPSWLVPYAVRERTGARLVVRRGACLFGGGELCRRAVPRNAWRTPSPLRRRPRRIFQVLVRAEVRLVRARTCGRERFVPFQSSRSSAKGSPVKTTWSLPSPATTHHRVSSNVGSWEARRSPRAKTSSSLPSAEKSPAA